MSSPIRQEDASGRHDVASGRQCIVRKLSAIASGRDQVVSRSSYVRLCVATGASIGRHYVVKQIIWRCTGDALAIFDDLAVVKTLPVHRQTSPVGVKGALVSRPKKMTKKWIFYIIPMMSYPISIKTPFRIWKKLVPCFILFQPV